MPSFDFEQAVLQRSFAIPVLVDFWAPWCGPCRTLTPVLERVVSRYVDRCELVKLNTEEYPEIAYRYGVRGIPNVKLFIDGQVVDEFTGALPESVIEEWLQGALPRPQSEEWQTAQDLVAQGRRGEAIPLLKRILEAEPEHCEARVLLAKLLLYKDPDGAVELVQGLGPDSEQHAEAESIRTLGRLFRVADHPETLPDDPVKPLYLEAIRNLREERYEQALEEWIEVVRRARSYDGDGARKACIAVFQWLGDGHELSRRYRARLASALYV
jgi:putative thioredoxin